MGRALATSRQAARSDLPSVQALISEGESLLRRVDPNFNPGKARRCRLYLQLLRDIQRERKRCYTRFSFADSVERDEHDWAEGVREWFARVKKMLPDEHGRWVCYFGSRQLECLEKGKADLLFPPHRQDQLGHPCCLDEMPVIEDLTPRIGGRRASPQIQDRNELIRRFRAEAQTKGLRGQTHRYICRKLDEAKVPTPWTEFRSWLKPHLSNPTYRARIDSIFSKA